MTDNGSSGGATLDDAGFVCAGYNAGMRGKKGSYYEGATGFRFLCAGRQEAFVVVVTGKRALL